MEEIIKQVIQKTGVEHAIVQKVLHEAVNVVKGHLPPAIAGQLDHLLANAGGGGAAGGTPPAGSDAGHSGGGLGGMLGGLFGK